MSSRSAAVSPRSARFAPVATVATVATIRIVFVLLALEAVIRAAHGQNFNIDVGVIDGSGPHSGPPASTFGGAGGQTGDWFHTGGSISWTNLPDINGDATTADLSCSGLTTMSWFDNPDISGNYELLMGDWATVTNGNTVTYTFTQLDRGVYSVYTYAASTLNATARVSVAVSGADESAQTVGGDITSNTFTPGLTHALHHVHTTTGSIHIVISGTVSNGGVNGIQLIYHGAPWPRMFVDSGAGAGNRTGLSWPNACVRLQDALITAKYASTPVDEIWVANGSYSPSRTNNRSESFEVTSGLEVYGGFAGSVRGVGGETDLDQRDIAANPVVLTGNIGLPITSIDNSYHVVDLGGTDDTTILDGFTITSGHASGTSFDGYGGGIQLATSSAKVRNCRIINNFAMIGGGAWMTGGAPQFQRCDFVNNTSDGPGGGLRAIASASLVAVHNCRFLGNDAANDGGGVSTSNQNVWMANCVFSGNTAGENGGAVLGTGPDGDVRLYHCTVGYNDAFMSAGGVRGDGGADARLYNSILWGNTDGQGAGVFNAQYEVEVPGIVEAQYNIIQSVSGLPTANNGLTPLFIDANGPDNIIGTDDDNYRVASNSPAIDSGINTQITLDVTDLDGDGVQLESVPVDLDDQPRRVDDPDVTDTGNGTAPIIDRGAYERPLPQCLADIAPLPNGDELVNVQDLLAVIAVWGPCANPNACPADIAPAPSGDDTVNVQDLLAVIAAWGACP